MSSHLLVIALRTFLAVTLPFASLISQATEPAKDLLQLHQLRLTLQKSLGDFYMLNSMEGDQRYARLINESLSQAQGHLNALKETPGPGSQALRNQLEQDWNAYQAALLSLTEALRKQGYTDLQPVADLAESNEQLMNLSLEFYARLQQESGYSVPPLTQRSREQSQLMQAIAVDYAARSASVGATFIGGEARPIEDLVKDFTSKLSSLERAPQNNAQLRQGWDSVNTKWRYIEKSLINYNENSVPFLVHKYSGTIIQSIEGIAAQYAAASL
jgi:hypothetical protein